MSGIVKRLTKAPATQVFKTERFVKRTDLSAKIEKLQQKGWELLKENANLALAKKKFEKAVEILEKNDVKILPGKKVQLYHRMAIVCRKNYDFSQASSAVIKALDARPSQLLFRKITLLQIRLYNEQGAFVNAKTAASAQMSDQLGDLTRRSKLIHEYAKSLKGLRKSLTEIDFPQRHPVGGVSITKPIEAYRYLSNYYVFIKAFDGPQEASTYYARLDNILREALALGLPQNEQLELQKLFSEQRQGKI